MRDARDETIRRLQVRLPEWLLRKLKESAEQNKRSLNSEVLWALEKYTVSDNPVGRKG